MTDDKLRRSDASSSRYFKSSDDQRSKSRYFPNDEPVPTRTSQPDMFGVPDVGGERDSLDRYYSPGWATQALVAYLGEARLVGPIWEPCAGQCHIATVLRDCGFEVIATDVVPHESLNATLDFLVSNSHEVLPRAGAKWIITNPPYTLPDGTTAADFVKRALDIAELGVAMLLRAGWIEPCTDRVGIFQDTPPTDLVVLPRVNFIGAPSQNPGTSIWFVWDKQLSHSWGGQRVHWYSNADCYAFGKRPKT